MPRTRSLAWSELKIGIIAVAALVLAAMLIFAVGGAGGFSWQRYELKTKFRRRAGAEERRRRPRRRRRGRARSTEVEFVGTGRRGRAGSRRRTSRASRPVARVDRIAEPARRAGHRHQRRRPTGTPLKDGDYIQPAEAGGAARPTSPTARTRASVRATGAPQGHPRRQGHRRQAVHRRRALPGAQRVRRVARRRSRVRIQQGRGTLGKLIKDPPAYDELNAVARRTCRR